MKKSKRKILMLTMSCNQPHFQALLSAVKNTWAKPVIEGKYDNITWFAYTACDKKHPKPMIDFENHMIYVDVDDRLEGTYYKTYDAYHMIKDMVDFDYVVRTNTSVYVNIDNMVDRFNNVWDNDEMCIIGNFATGRKYDIISGYFYAMNKNLFEIGMGNRCVVCDDSEKDWYYDDVVLSKNIHNYYNSKIWAYAMINKNKKIYWFGDILESYQIHTNFVKTNDVTVVNNNVMIRVRAKFEQPRDKQRECENFYQLYNAQIHNP